MGGGKDEGVECTVVGRDDKHGLAVRILPSDLKPSTLAKIVAAAKESREEALVTDFSKNSENGDDDDDDVRVGTFKEHITKDDDDVYVDRTGDDTENTTTCISKKLEPSSSEAVDLSFVSSIRRSRILKKITKLREQMKLSLTENERATFEESLKIEILNLERKNREQEKHSVDRISSNIKSKNKNNMSTASSAAATTVTTTTTTITSTDLDTIMDKDDEEEEASVGNDETKMDEQK